MPRIGYTSWVLFRLPKLRKQIRVLWDKISGSSASLPKSQIESHAQEKSELESHAKATPHPGPYPRNHPTSSHVIFPSITIKRFATEELKTAEEVKAARYYSSEGGHGTPSDRLLCQTRRRIQLTIKSCAERWYKKELHQLITTTANDITICQSSNPPPFILHGS